MKKSVLSARSFCLSESLESRQLFAAPSASVPFGLTDTTFGTSGHAYATGKYYDNPTHAVVGSDGKIYVADGLYIARFTATGKLDATFGTRGILTLPGGTFVGQAVDSSNRLDVVIAIGSSGHFRTALLRYTTAGQTDTTFGIGGSVIVSSDTLFTPTAVDVQPDAKVVIAGTETTSAGEGREMHVYRVNADGSADTSFGTSGITTAYLGSNTALTTTIFDVVDRVKVLSSGDIEIGGGTVAFASGDSPIFSDGNEAVARFTAGGALDSSFGAGGIVRGLYTVASEFTGTDTSSLLAGLPSAFDIRDDGSAVLGGVHLVDDANVSNVIGLDSAGNLVYNRILPSDPLIQSSVATLLALPDGRAVAAGYTNDSMTSLTQLAADGTVGPIVTNDDLNSSTDDVTASTTLALSSSGQLLLAGSGAGSQTLVVQQLNASTAAAPRPDNFSHAGPTSIDIGGGYAYVAYYDTAARNLKFARRLPNGQWTSPVTIDAHVGAGSNVSVQADANGEPVIAYYDSRTKSLKSAASRNFGRTFALTSVDAVGAVGQHVDGTMNPGTGSVDFAYYDATNGNLKLATRTVAGKWSTTVVDASKDNVGTQIAVTVNADTNHVMIAYYDATAKEVKYAGQTLTGFKIKDVTPASGGIEGLTILSTENAMPAIAYHDLSSDQVRLAIFPPGATRFVAHSIASHTGQALALIDSPTSQNPSVLQYDRNTRQLSVVRDPLEDRTTTQTLGGGAYLDAYTSNSGTLAALVDSATGTLQVRDVLSL